MRNEPRSARRKCLRESRGMSGKFRSWKGIIRTLAQSQSHTGNCFTAQKDRFYLLALGRQSPYFWGISLETPEVTGDYRQTCVMVHYNRPPPRTNMTPSWNRSPQRDLRASMVPLCAAWWSSVYRCCSVRFLISQSNLSLLLGPLWATGSTQL